MHSSSDQLPPPGETARLLLRGPAGHIETIVAVPKTPRSPRGCCVVCHPHPLFGGSMTNKVAHTLANTAVKAGLVALRFNFRGVGRSGGVHDDARGETDDTVVVAEWLRARMGQPQPRLVLAGFSFGAYVSLKAAARLHPALQISVSVPFGRYVDGASPPPHPGCPWLTLHSTDDDVVDYAETAAVLDGYTPPPERVVLDGAGHFYHGRLGDVERAVQRFIDAHWPKED
jgi:alpha/beta superfamily hydrolase